MPVTERVSAVTREIDACDDAAGVLRLMAACDGELYVTSCHGHPGLASDEVVGVIAELAGVVASCVGANGVPTGGGQLTEPFDRGRVPREREEEGAGSARSVGGDGGDEEGGDGWRARRTSSGGRGAVFISGAGTSGRLAFLAATWANEMLAARGRPPCFHHVIAGGDAALFRCVESAEDDRDAAARDFDAAVAAAGGDAVTDALFVGVSCGLSASYVAAQLARAMDDERGRFSVACVGFNPKKHARDAGSVHAAPSFRDVLRRMEAEAGGVRASGCGSGGDDRGGEMSARLRRRLIVTPVVGPEAIAGSSRLKGGTATKLILDAAFAVALTLVEEDGNRNRNDADARRTTDLVRDCIVAGSAATRAASPRGGAGDDLAAVVDRAGACLRDGGRIHYVGGGATGALALIDAAEQVPTFGARREDVQGWVRGGEAALGVAASVGGESVDVSEATFARTVAPTLRRVDMVVVLADEENPTGVGEETFDALAAAVGDRGTNVAVVAVAVTMGGRDVSSGRAATGWLARWTDRRERLRLAAVTARAGVVLGVNVTVPLERFGESASASFAPLFAPRAAELAVKHVVNGISTGAHVLVGKVFGARMIDVRVSNEKLFHRAARIVAEVAGVSSSTATRALVRAIHEGRTVKQQQEGPVDRSVAETEASMNAHVAAAIDADRVVPVAVLLATGRWHSAASARAEVREGRNVRGILKAAGVSARA